MKRIYRQNEVRKLIEKLECDHYVGLASGYFHPFLHIGHIQYLESCKSWCNKLVVVVNGVNSTIRKYGSEIVSIEDRLQILSSIRYVDYVIDYDTDDICLAIKDIIPQRLLKGGDRQIGKNLKAEEVQICESLGIEIIDGCGGYDKQDSNSDIIKRIIENWQINVRN